MDEYDQRTVEGRLRGRIVDMTDDETVTYRETMYLCAGASVTLAAPFEGDDA